MFKRYTKKRGAAFAKMAKNDNFYHIIPISPSEWYFIQHSKVDPEKIFKTKEEAIKYAKEKLKKEKDTKDAVSSLKNDNHSRRTNLISPKYQEKKVYIHGDDGNVIEEF